MNEGRELIRASFCFDSAAGHDFRHQNSLDYCDHASYLRCIRRLVEVGAPGVPIRRQRDGASAWWSDHGSSEKTVG
jgi:hypothetical protein